MRCRRCRARAVIDLRRHNAGFCRECFLRYFQGQVERAISHDHMIVHGERVLVAVSGGKDSLALWDVLTRLGYEVDGLYLGLGIGDYSDGAARSVREFARGRPGRLIEVDLSAEYGFDVPAGAAATRRAPCGTCGLSKRHIFNDVARREGYDVLATGHNLDDEAAVLFGNVLRWETSYLGRQAPVLAATDGFVRKVKPLFRVTERESAAYCVLVGIDYQVEECPMAEGNRHLGYKEILDELERRSPGTKTAFLFGFLERGRPRFVTEVDAERAALGSCSECGAPTPGETCAFCRLRHRVTGGSQTSVQLRVGS